MTELPVRYNAFAAIRFGRRNLDPPGANLWNEDGGGRPIVLLHGLGIDMATNWFTLAPLLANAGFRVFALNFGQFGHGLLSRSRPGVGDLEGCADELELLIDDVLEATGADKVALVGHSAGGLLAQYYLKRRGGAAKVSHFVGLAPTVHGTSFNGLLRVPLFRRIGAALVGENIAQQGSGSEFLADLDTDADTVPGVAYTMISPSWDLITTPVRAQRLQGHAVTNIRLRGVVEHVFIAFHREALEQVLVALGRK